MLVKDLMTTKVVSCTPWDTARTAASLMKERGVGAIPVVSDLSDPLLEGIVTDRDLCCGVVADAKNADAIQLSELMTPVPVTCEAEEPMLHRNSGDGVNRGSREIRSGQSHVDCRTYDPARQSHRSQCRGWRPHGEGKGVAGAR